MMVWFWVHVYIDGCVGYCDRRSKKNALSYTTPIPNPPPTPPQTISSYLTQTVLPSLRTQHDEFLLQEVKKRWEHHKRALSVFGLIYIPSYAFPPSSHHHHPRPPNPPPPKVFNHWMQRFFMYLDRYYVKHNSLPSLHSSGIKFFKELVYDQVCVCPFCVYTYRHK